MSVNEHLIDEIKSKNNIIDIISAYTQLKQNGKNYKGLCPFHNEKTPSFIVSEDKQLYHCFGCGQAGDVIEFISKKENLDFIDSLKFLGNRVGINIEEKTLNKEEKKAVEEKTKIYEINREAAIFYYKNLHKRGPEALAYLSKKRGLSMETIKKFGLGYALNNWDALNKYLLRKGYDQSLIYKSGLVLQKKEKKGFYDRFRNRTIFPIINTTGKVIGFGARSIGNEMPKYLNSPQTPVFNKSNNLFGLNVAKNQISNDKRIIVVEGYMDVISLYEKGIKNAVASLGTALTKGQGQLLKRYADKTYICYDSDVAGQTATLRGLDTLTEVGCEVKVISLKGAKDPDELVKEHGKGAFLKYVDDALTLVEYKISLAKEKYNIKTTDGSIKFVKEITPILKNLKSPVEVDAYIGKISSETGISRKAINKEFYGNNKEKNPESFKKYRSKKDRNNNKYNIIPEKPIKKQGYFEAEKIFLKLIIENENMYREIKNNFTYDKFISSNIKNIAKSIYRAYETNSLDKDEILKELEIEEIRLFHQINKIIVPEDNAHKMLIDCVNTIKKHRLILEKNGIEKELKIIEKRENKSKEEIVRIRELCINYEKILKELKKI
ncbi:MAG: DNA primase [Anaeromicrobium sp.]|jgi:DNA primase|uniref:DNA primase n=1 Tax=Anaeromicrobium sp. TaxID=1929132 RepID=UPI0025F1B06C|nr:DNA primase [Anaeromicrobium sp.]MCT4594576.1 DNA primase [Anaeromicrobium sp.]